MLSNLMYSFIMVSYTGIIFLYIWILKLFEPNGFINNLWYLYVIGILILLFYIAIKVAKTKLELMPIVIDIVIPSATVLFGYSNIVFRIFGYNVYDVISDGNWYTIMTKRKLSDIKEIKYVVMLSKSMLLEI